MVKVDMSGIEPRDGDGEEVPKGIYVVEVTDYSVFPVSENGNHPGADAWSLHQQIQDDPNFEGRMTFGRIQLPCQECAEAGENVDGHEGDNYTPYALFNLLRATIGQHDWTEEDISKGAIDVDADDLVGLRYRVRWGKQKNSDYMGTKKFLPLKDGEEADSDLLP